MALQQGPQGAQFRCVQLRVIAEALGAAIDLLPQMAAEQVRERHLSPRPGRHGGALAAGGLDLGRHLPQPHELQLAAGKKEDIARFEPPDEGLFHMAKNGPTYKAHRDGAVRGDRADVEAMVPRNRLVEHPVAIGLALLGGVVAAGLAAHQFAVAGVGPQALPSVLQKIQAPLPLALAEAAEAPAPADRLQLLGRFKPRAAGQGHQVLEQDIQRKFRWFAVFHQAIGQSPPHRRDLE